MSLIDPIFLTLVVGGFGFLIGGLVMRKHPPKDMNWVYGYRTKRSMASQEAWDFGQHYSSKKLILSGVIAMGISPCGFFLTQLQEPVKVVIGVILLLLFAFLPIISTERALKREFPKGSKKS